MACPFAAFIVLTDGMLIWHHSHKATWCHDISCCVAHHRPQLSKAEQQYAGLQLHVCLKTGRALPRPEDATDNVTQSSGRRACLAHRYSDSVEPAERMRSRPALQNPGRKDDSATRCTARGGARHWPVQVQRTVPPMCEDTAASFAARVLTEFPVAQRGLRRQNPADAQASPALRQLIPRY